jgi:hypothetical protein
MKIRDSGMPDEGTWESFFDPQLTLHRSCDSPAALSLWTRRAKARTAHQVMLVRASIHRSRKCTLAHVAQDSHRSRRTRMHMHVNGFWGFIVLVADVWAIVNIFQSAASTQAKVLWTVLVIVLPVLGFIIWLLAGPKTAK